MPLSKHDKNIVGDVAEDLTYDVIIIGSGAAALMSACRCRDLGASVLVLEKTGRIGGTSATSGGGIWVPNNAQMAVAGIADNEKDAFDYLRNVIPADQISDDTIRTYISWSSKMIEYLGQIGVPYSPVKKYPDYYPSLPGWKEGGRTMDCEPFDGRKLGDDLYLLREMPEASKAFGRINLSITEASKIQAVAKGWQKIATKAVIRYLSDVKGRLKGRRDRRLCMGEALVGRLLLAVRKRETDFLLNSPVIGLLREDDKICGVEIEHKDGQLQRIKSRRGVIVAAGGFERSAEMRKQYLANPTQPDWSAGSPGNTGDLINAGRKIGAAIGRMNEAWWAPVVRWGEKTIVLFFEKSKPGLIIVDRTGRRFMNESITYNSYGKCIYGEDYTLSDHVPAYVIFDGHYRKRYMFAGLLQASMSPDWMNRKAFGPDGLLQKASTLRELAAKLGIDVDGLEATATEVAGYARTGIDEKFGRGSDEHDRMYGDERVHPNPCLGSMAKGPFYGARLYPGDIGTKGGLVINDHAQVLDEEKQPIEGLYAAGNSTASIMGDKYPGAGCTLGPALTMAFRASNSIMQVDAG